MNINLVRLIAIPTLLLSSLSVNSAEFLPPNLAFKPTINENIVTISVADGYYLYQSNIAITDQNKAIPFNFVNKPIVKNFPQIGKTNVYSKVAQIQLPPNIKPQNLSIRFQGCSYQGLCYPPQTVILKLNKS